MSLKGTIKKIDKYNKLVLFIKDPYMINHVSDNIDKEHRTPFQCTDDGVEYYINIPIYRHYITDLLKNHINKEIAIDVTLKKYNFDNIKGTSLILRSVEDICQSD